MIVLRYRENCSELTMLEWLESLKEDLERNTVGEPALGIRDDDIDDVD